MSDSIVMANGGTLRLSDETIKNRQQELKCFREEMAAIDLLFKDRVDRAPTCYFDHCEIKNAIQEKHRTQERCAIKYGLM